MNILKRLGLTWRRGKPAPPAATEFDLSGPAALIDERYRRLRVIERHNNGTLSRLVVGRETFLGRLPTDPDVVAIRVVG